MTQRTCTRCDSFVSLNHIDTHYNEYHSSEKNKWPILSERYRNGMMSSESSEDDAEDDESTNDNSTSSSDNSSRLSSSSAHLRTPFSTDFEVFGYHVPTTEEVTERENDNVSYPIAWYGKPFRCAHFKDGFAMRTLWWNLDDLYTESVKQMIKLYPDFKEKLLNSEFKDMIFNTNTIIDIDKLDWRQKALLIVDSSIKDELSKAFLQKVDEKRDAAPNYYKAIKEPMDLTTLKSLINNKKIPSAKKFVTNLMLIWDNAQAYNKQSSEIYQYAVKLKTKSNKLIKKYFPNNYGSLYESKRRSKRLKSKQQCNVSNDKIDIAIIDNKNQCLLCSQCNNRLKFMCGFHINCQCLNENNNNNNNNNNIQSEDEHWEGKQLATAVAQKKKYKNMGPKCNECQIEINNTKICYYHCINGCQINNICGNEDEDNDLIEFHSVFLCEMCAEKRFKISKQSKIELISNNINERRLSFYGCFVDLLANGKDLWYEAIKMQCDGNKIYYELILSSETNKRFITEAKIRDENKLIFEVSERRTNFTKGILSDNGLILKFIDKNDNNDTNTFKKTCIFCKKCNAETMFMLSNTFPTTDISSPIYCDTHQIYYEKQKALPNNQRCLSFKLLDDEYNNNIYKQDFYFSCVKCNDFDQCAICTLIQHEIQFKNKYMINNHQLQQPSQPSQKRQRIDNTMYIERNNPQILSPIYHDMPPLTASVTPIKSITVNKKQKSMECKKRQRNEIYDRIDRIDSNSNTHSSNVSIITNISSNSNIASMNYEYEKLKELYIIEKRKNQELNRIKIINDNLRSELEISQLQNESLQRKYNNNNNNLSAQIVKLTNERDQCIQSFNQLKQKVMNVCNNYTINKMK